MDAAQGRGVCFSWSAAFIALCALACCSVAVGLAGLRRLHSIKHCAAMGEAEVAKISQTWWYMA